MPELKQTAQTYPHKPAIVAGESGEMVTYGQLDERANRGVRLLRSLGLAPGERIALLLDNTPAWLEICWAARRAGLVFIPLPVNTPGGELRALLADSGARLLLAAHSLAATAVGLRDALPDAVGALMAGGVAGGYESWEEAIDAQSGDPLADAACGVPQFYVPGPDGTPEAVLPEEPAGDPDAPPPLTAGVGAAFGFGEETVFLSPAPLYTPASLLYYMMTLYQGGTCVLLEEFIPETALALIDEHKVTHSLWLPAMLASLLRLPAEVRERYDLGSMQYAIHTGTPCPVQLKEQIIDWWGPVLVEYYAAASGEGATAIDSSEWLSHKGSVGRALIGNVEIVDAAGNSLPAGQPGRIRFSGELEPGGDLGYLDEDGYLYVTERRDAAVMTDGEMVYPRDIERLLMTHEKVADVAVLGLPGDEFGEQLHAEVEPANWADATDETAIEILEWLRERLEHIMVPGSVGFRRSLPREEGGKVYRHRLMEELRGGSRDDNPSGDS